MGRKWIGIELGEHCYTHCLPRLQKVVDGSDKEEFQNPSTGTVAEVFAFMNLLPVCWKKTITETLSFPKSTMRKCWQRQWQSKKTFATAQTKLHFGNKENPPKNDYIYTTTQYLTVEMLDHIHGEMKAEESVLICCKAFDSACKHRFENITIKKFHKCFWEDVNLTKTIIPSISSIFRECDKKMKRGKRKWKPEISETPETETLLCCKIMDF